MSAQARRMMEDVQDAKIDKAAMSNDFPMTAARTDKVVTESVALQGDLLSRRKSWVTGALKNDSFIYSSKATTSGGSVTFYLTTDGTSGGSAVFNNVYPDTISVVAYGGGANYQPFNPVVSGDNKSITVSINQATSVLLGLIQLLSASNGIDCRLYVMGD